MAYTPQEEAAWAQYQAQQQSQQQAPTQQVQASSYTPEEEAAWAQYQKSQGQAAPPQNNSSGNWLWDQATSIGRAIANPAVELAEGTQNLVSRGLGVITGKPPETFGMYHDDLIKNAANPTEAALLSIPASFLLPGGALLKGAKGIEALVTGAGLGAGYGAAMGASQDQNSNILKDSAIGAAIPTAIMGLLRGVPAAVNATVNLGKSTLAKSVLNNLDKASQQPYSSVATPQQAATKLGMIGDAPVDIGHLVGDVGLSEKYKKGSNLWFSNNPQRMQEVVGRTDQLADNVANQMWQGHDENTGTQAVLDHIKSNYKSIQSTSDDNYETLMQQAQDRGVTTNYRPNSQGVAKQLIADNQKTGWLDDINKKISKSIYNAAKPINVDNPPPALKTPSDNVYSAPGSWGDFDDVLTNIANGNPSSTNADKDFNDLKNVRSKLGERLRYLQSMPANNRPLYAIGKLQNLYNSFGSDMQQNLQTQAPDLHSNWLDANSFYRKNVTPYLKNNTVNNLVNSDSTQNIFNTLNESDPQIQQVVSHMSPQYQKLLLGLGMKNAISQDVANGGVEGNATKLSNAYAKLNNSPILQQTLTPNDHNLFKQLTVMNNFAKPYRPLLTKPETGAKNTPLMANLGQAGGTIGAMFLPHLLGAPGLLGASLGAGAAGATIKGGNILTDLMANPKILQAYANPEQRNSLIREAINSKASQTKGIVSGQKVDTNNIKPNALQKYLQSAGAQATSKISDPRFINYLLNMGA